MPFRNRYYAEKKPKLTYFLISLFIGVYVLEVVLQYLYGEDFINQIFYAYGFSLKSFLDGNWWNIITSIFLHGSPDHLVLNMIALYFFGKVVETELEKRKFLAIFFLSGAFGDVLLALMSLLGVYPAAVPTVGASGAIFGLMGTAMIVKPLEMVFYPYLVPVPLFTVAFLYTLYNIAAFFMYMLGADKTQIAYAAHIGGLLVGLAFGLKYEGRKRGLLILLLFVIFLLLAPFFWTVLSYLEATNYVEGLIKIFSR